VAKVTGDDMASLLPMVRLTLTDLSDSAGAQLILGRR